MLSKWMGEQEVELVKPFITKERVVLCRWKTNLLNLVRNKGI